MAPDVRRAPGTDKINSYKVMTVNKASPLTSPIPINQLNQLFPLLRLILILDPVLNGADVRRVGLAGDGAVDDGLGRGPLAAAAALEDDVDVGLPDARDPGHAGQL